MPDCIDQTGRIVFIKTNPQRIISLVPSQTELLADLGLTDQVVGITKFCVHPASWFHSKTRVGGTKQLKMDLIRKLQPDLIIANKEENVKEQIEELAKEFPAWLSDVQTLEDAYKMIYQVGLITHRETVAGELLTQIKTNFTKLPISTHPIPSLYLIWQKPYMAAGSDTFIHTMMEVAGFSNLLSGRKRYPEISLQQLRELNPPLLLLPSEPFPFKQKHADAFQSLLPQSRVLLVDGEMFSWYGSRLLKAADYFRKLRVKNYEL